MRNSEKAKQNTVYIFDATTKKVASEKTISTAISDVYFLQFDRKETNGSIKKFDGLCFFGDCELYVCDPSATLFRAFASCETGPKVEECHAILQAPSDKKIAFRDEQPSLIKIMDLNNDFQEETLPPIADGKSKPSFVSFCESVGQGH